MSDQSWRSDAPAKWDMIASGKWMQKVVWNRWVTTLERDQPHKTPIISTWTADFLTREGEGRKAVGDWLRDKTISWKARRNSFRRMRVFSHVRLACKNGANKWRKGLFEERSEDTDGDQQMQDQNWRSDASAKWDIVATGKWMQKTAWNRWMTTSERDQPHKTPITSTWTTDFLTREGEGRKAVGDW